MGDHLLDSYIEDQASWRRRKAAEYPDDHDRNTRGAERLTSLVAHIREGKADQTVIERIERPTRDAGLDVLMLGNEAGQSGVMVARYGFDAHSIKDHDEFLAALADAVESEQADG